MFTRYLGQRGDEFAAVMAVDGVGDWENAWQELSGTLWREEGDRLNAAGALVTAGQPGDMDEALPTDVDGVGETEAYRQFAAASQASAWATMQNGRPVRRQTVPTRCPVCLARPGYYHTLGCVAEQEA